MKKAKALISALLACILVFGIFTVCFAEEKTVAETEPNNDKAAATEFDMEGTATGSLSDASDTDVCLRNACSGVVGQPSGKIVSRKEFNIFLEIIPCEVIPCKSFGGFRNLNAHLAENIGSIEHHIELLGVRQGIICAFILVWCDRAIVEIVDDIVPPVHITQRI